MSLKEKLLQIPKDKEEKRIVTAAQAFKAEHEEQQELEAKQALQNELLLVAKKSFMPILEEINQYSAQGKGKIKHYTTDALKGHPHTIGASVEISWDYSDSGCNSIGMHLDSLHNVIVIHGGCRWYTTGYGTQTPYGVDTNLKEIDWKEKIEDIIVEKIKNESCRYVFPEEPDLPDFSRD